MSCRSHSLSLSQLLKPLKLSHSSRKARRATRDKMARHDTIRGEPTRAEGSRNAGGQARLSHLPSVAGLSWAIVVAAESAKHTLSLSTCCWLCYWWEGSSCRCRRRRRSCFELIIFVFVCSDFHYVVSFAMQTSLLLLLLLFELLLPPPLLFFCSAAAAASAPALAI